MNIWVKNTCTVVFLFFGKDWIYVFVLFLFIKFYNLYFCVEVSSVCVMGTKLQNNNDNRNEILTVVVPAVLQFKVTRTLEYSCIWFVQAWTKSTEKEAVNMFLNFFLHSWCMILVIIYIFRYSFKNGKIRKKEATQRR